MHKRAHRTDMYSLTITQLALTIMIGKEVSLHRHDLGLKEVAKLGSEMTMTLRKVERLRKIGWDLERERYAGLPENVIVDKCNHLCFLPDTTLPYMRISLAFVAVVDLLTHINQLELQLNAISWNSTV